MESDDRKKQMRFAASPIRPLIAVGVGVGVGVGLIAVGVIALSGPPSTPDPRLAATTGAVTAPPEGAYWHIRKLSKAPHDLQLGNGSNRYRVEKRGISESWTSTDGRTWSGSRTLGTRPKSAADERAWRRDGSPATWSRTAKGIPVSLSTKPGKGNLVPMKDPATFRVAGQQLSYEELQRLPADPAGLKNWIEKAARASQADPSEESVNAHVTGTLTTLLHEVPVPKRIRVAAYQALPTVPGVRALGKTEDSQGRTGQGFSINHGESQKNDSIAAWDEVIVNTDTMLLLANSLKVSLNGKPFQPIWTETMLQIGWTDDEPSVPALP